MNKQHSIRVTFIFLLFCFLYMIILFNLYLIQIKDNDFFTNLGEKQYNVTITTAPPRAFIFDRSNKKMLAMNQESIAAFLLPKTVGNTADVQTFLKQHFPQAYQRLQHNSRTNFMYIKRNLTEQELSIIQEYAPHDIKLLREPSRFYPLEATSQIIGITDIDNKGLFGIELQFNDTLAGKPTTYSLEKDARSGYFHFKKETKIKGKEGQPITLTIDSDLQFLVYDELKETIKKLQAEEGTALVMDPNNGDILAMVNFPSFKPHKKNNLTIEHTKNKVVTDSYELGSVIKVCAALAAIEEGVVEPDELIDCKNKTTTYIDGRKINTWKAHGTIPFSNVIAVSNNIGIAQVAKRLDDKLFEHYVRMGFGTKTGIPFPGENKGFVNPPYSWSKQSIISLSYGYEISATSLQLAKAFSIIANGGHDVQPKLVISKDETLHKQPTKKLYSDKSISNIKNILEKTTLEGTARRAGIKGYKIMSKTGTANMLENGTYNPNKHIYTCAGIVERDKYQRVIVTFVKNVPQARTFASTIAAPLFERIAEKVVIHDKVI